MKQLNRILMLAVCLMAFGVIGFGQTKPDKPTLQETLDWLKDKLTSGASFSTKPGSDTQTVYKFEPIIFPVVVFLGENP